jgi:hypothetical protein
MASIRINRFAGLMPTANPKALPNDHAQIAHNCLLWDGWLWPMPQWKDELFYGTSILSLYKDITKPLGFDASFYVRNAVYTPVEPFNDARVIGIVSDQFLGTFEFAAHRQSAYRALGTPAPKYKMDMYGNILYPATFYVSPQHKSVYPISRTYAITYVNDGREGPPLVFPQLTSGSDFFGSSVDHLYEGDIVTLNVQLELAVNAMNKAVTSIRLYRTIPGFDTSEELGNPLETGFHLVKEVPIGNPGDGASFIDANTLYVFIADDVGYPNSDSAKIPGDLLISEQWLPPVEFNTPLKPLYFGLTEGGWFVDARANGDYSSAVQFSERFMSHAWPMQNTVVIPEIITGIAIFYDNVFVGTKSLAYHLDVQSGDTETLNLQVRPYSVPRQCIKDTMVATNFGAMFASKDGLITLTEKEETVATRAIANPGDIIPVVFAGNVVNKQFTDITKGGWWDGNYFGFIDIVDGVHNPALDNAGVAIVYNQPSPSSAEFPLGQLVTIDAPHSVIKDTIATGTGFYVVGYPDSNVYSLPLPGYGYTVAPKARYTWKSKRFVMQGLTTFAGMKVINSNNGDLVVTLSGYWDGAETVPSFVFTRTLSHSRPFRLPHNHKCLEWEIQVVGTAIIEEIHLSTSYKDLIEDSNVSTSATA